MHSMSLFVELLRTRPRRLFWTMAVLQAAAVDARAGAVLCRASRSASAGAGDRARISVRHRIRSAARVLARGDRVSPGRHDRRLFSFADLHCRHLLGGVCARPRHRRHAARGDGGDADGRHRGVLGADAGVRARDPRHAAVGADAAALLDGCAARSMDLLGRARPGGGPVAAHHIRRADPGGAAADLHGVDQVRPRPDRDRRSLDRRRRDDRGAVSISGLARLERRHQLPGPCDHCRQSARLGLARCRLAREPCRHGDSDPVGTRHMGRLAQPGAGGYSRASASGGARLCLFLCVHADRGDGAVCTIHPPSGEFPHGASRGDVGARGDRGGR